MIYCAFFNYKFSTYKIFRKEDTICFCFMNEGNDSKGSEQKCVKIIEFKIKEYRIEAMLKKRIEKDCKSGN